MMDLEKLKEMKAPVWGLTAVGVAIGLLGGPVGVAIGALVGGGLDFLRHSHRESWRAWHPLDELHLRAVRLVAPRVPDALIQHKAAVAGNDPPGAAVALQKFLDDNAEHRAAGDAFWKSQAVRARVAAFQQAFNADIPTSGDVGKLTVSGLFSPKTAAALTLYMHRSTSPDPDIAS